MLDSVKESMRHAGMDAIDRIRAFSRFYTARLGLLSRGYLGLGLAEARVIHDLGPQPVRTRTLAAALDLDEAQLSRLLARLEQRGLVRRSGAGDDLRRRDVSLTDQGLAERDRLHAASRAALSAMLADLPPGAAGAAARALGEAQAHLSGAAPVVLRDLLPGDAGWIVSRHGELYARDEGFDASFEALVAEIVATFLRRHDPSRERGWIAEAAGRRLGSIFCVTETAETAKLRLFLLEPEARGTGLAQRLLDACLGFARDAGYRHIRLWTHESHRAAGRLYARNGFALTANRPARSFGRDVVEQTWERPL